MKRRLLWVALLLFGSGTTALIYQVAWMRELRLIFGFSTAASAAVLAIFMGGLGAGSWWLGRKADETAHPLAFYGRLELGVAGSAAITPLLVFLVRQAYIAVGGTLTLGLAAGTVARLLFSAVVLCVPTALMGGTLPAATRAVETDEDSARRYLALLYGSNTIGAVTGAVLSTFLLLETFGTRLTLWLACAVNALVGLAAVRLSRRAPPAPVPEKASEDSRPAIPEPRSAQMPQKKEKHKKAPKREEGASGQPSAVQAGRSRVRGFVLASAGIVGFAFFLMELVWYRMLAPLLGGSTYTFGLILAIALAGIGTGSAVYWLAGRGRAPSLPGFAATCALEALCLIVPYALGDRLALLAALLRPIGAFGFGGYVAGWSLVAGIVVFPAAFVAGLQFPLLIALLGQGRDRVGSDVGMAYAWNTAGGIAGSLAGGFGLLPLLSASGTWVFVALLLCALALLALLLFGRVGEAEMGRGTGNRGRIGLGLGAAAACLVLLLAAPGPTAAWRHSPVGAGRVDLGKPSPNSLIDWLRGRRRILAWEKDGVESSVALVKASDGYAFVISGKTDGSSRGDAATQVMGGLIGAALHPNPRRGLVIGLGTGSTAGWLAAVPTIERVDVVELEPAILRVARDCSQVNHDVLGNPRVRIWIGDAREWLLASREKYDVIFSEPSNPYRAGISSLFTADFYRAARSRLAPGGIFLQWLQAYEVDSGTVRTVYATLGSVFPEVETWHTKQNDLILAATMEPIAYDSGRLRERLRQEPYFSALRDAWRVSGLEGFLSHYVARPSLTRTLISSGHTPLNTDDANVVEFAFARSLGHDTFFDVEELRQAARSSQEDRPAVSGDVDWASVDRWRVGAATSQGRPPTATPGMTVEELRQALAQKSFVEGRPEAVLANWRAGAWEPRGSIEEIVLAEALAQGGEELAADYIERIRQRRGVEADVLLARLRWRQGRLEEAVQALERAFQAYRDDPWPLAVLVRNSFSVVLDIASRDAALAGRLEESLAHPFSLFLLDEERHLIRLEVAARLDDSRYARAVEEMEPDVPWRRPILERRAQAYTATGNSHASVARRELAKFMESEPPPFAPEAAPRKN
jgi:spermidine synthase/MFS family permease